MQESYKLRYHSNLTYQERGFGVKQVKTQNKIRLSFEELEQLMELDLSDNSRLERVRDLLIAGCNIGLRISDWHKVNRENPIEEEGEELFEILTQKTGQKVFIPCLPDSKAVLEKYDYQLPEISSQKFNAYIKEVCEMAAIDTTLLRVCSEVGTVDNERIEKWKRSLTGRLFGRRLGQRVK